MDRLQLIIIRLLYYLPMERMKKPKFIKEIEKSEWKERAKCWRWYIRVYWELDNKPMVELESLEIIVKELHKLEEKVRFLEECLDRKEKLNEKYRKELKNYVYDAKQVRDIC